MKLTLGFSPCPNDTFIFDALVNGKIDTGGLEFEVMLEDVQTLNEWALQGRLDISKISYGVLPKILKDYRVLSSGGALGKGVGPLLIGKTEPPSPLTHLPGGGRGACHTALASFMNQASIAIPGENTTAHFLFSQAFPEATKKAFLRFDEIENWVQGGNGLGVIIHENRFTYQDKGLHKWMDLGENWEQVTGLPIPLGGIVVRKNLSTETILQLNKAIQNSLAYAWKHYPLLSDYVQCHSQEMEIPVMKQHIELYVNDFSHDMKEAGRNAVLGMLKVLGNSALQASEVFA